MLREMASLALGGGGERKVVHVFLKPFLHPFSYEKAKFHLTQFPFNRKKVCGVERAGAWVSQSPGLHLIPRPIITCWSCGPSKHAVSKPRSLTGRTQMSETITHVARTTRRDCRVQKAPGTQQVLSACSFAFSQAHATPKRRSAGTVAAAGKDWA